MVNHPRDPRESWPFPDCTLPCCGAFFSPAFRTNALNLTAFLILGCLAFVAVAAVAAAASGRDIQAFERMRSTSPKQYRGMKRTLKINGPMIALMCVVIMIGSSIAVLTGDTTAPLATLTITGSGIFLWLSVRWTRWAYG